MLLPGLALFFNFALKFWAKISFVFLKIVLINRVYCYFCQLALLNISLSVKQQMVLNAIRFFLAV